jgi:hypothetical protein
MALLCGATSEQIALFARYDAEVSINAETRPVNGANQTFMIAVNQVNLAVLEESIAVMGPHGKWQCAQSYLGRTIAHALFLPSPSKGNPTEAEFVQMIQFLQSQGVRFDLPDDCGHTAIDYAFVYYPQLVRLIQGESSPPKPLSRTQLKDFWGLTEVHDAVMRGDLEKLQRLIDDGALARDNSTHQTPLHLLCCKAVSIPEKTKAMAALLMTLEAKGICMNQTDINGFYPVHNAAIYGEVTVFEYLLSVQYGGKTLGEQLADLQDSHARTVAHDVCMNGPATNEDSVLIVKLILTQCGPNIFMQPDIYGIPPIVYAYICKPFLVPIIVDSLKLLPTDIVEYLSKLPSVGELAKTLPSIEQLLTCLKPAEPKNPHFIHLYHQHNATHGAGAAEPTSCVIS